jgi:hypothetical protein
MYAEGRYFPAVLLGEFVNAHAAVRSIGITGHTADLCAFGLADKPERPTIYEAEFLAGGTKRTIILVLYTTGAGTVRLLLGYFDLLAESEQEALRLAVEAAANGDILAGDFGEEPMFSAFQWTSPRGLLQ